MITHIQVFTVPIKQKSEVLSEFKKFKEFAEKQCGREIKVLRTNNGTEKITILRSLLKKMVFYLKKLVHTHQNKTAQLLPES